MPYDNKSINDFVQKQGGSLSNLGASPTYTGAPARSGTPPGPQNQQPYIQANPNAAFRQQMPPVGSAPQGRTSLANLGQPVDPRMRQQMMAMQRMNDPRNDPRYRQRMEMIRRQRMANPRRGNLANLGQPRTPAMTTAPAQPGTMQQPVMPYRGK